MRKSHLLAAALVALVLLAGCSASPGVTSQSAVPPAAAPSSASVPGAVGTEAAVPAETNPPGDIPDNQAFVPLKTAAGFTIKVPEGWSRSEEATGMVATDKLNTIQVRWSPAASAPTQVSAESADVAALRAAGGAFELVKVETVRLPAGEAVLVRYRVNSDPNQVTGKRYRLDVERYELFHAGMRVDVTLLSPVGADNVDPWRIVTRSLTW